MTDDEMIQTATTLVRAMMGSASTEKVRRIEWWSRAKSALETGAASASSFPSLISTMGRKLQVDVTTTRTGQLVAEVERAVGADFEAFRRYLEREALYIVAICQADSKARRELWEADQEAMAEDARQLADYAQAVVDAIPAKGSA